MSKSNENKESVSFDVNVIKRKVAESIRRPITTLDEAIHMYKSWFCIHYEIPYKSPILESYTLEELVWEYYDVMFRTDAKALDEYMPEEDMSKQAEDDEEWIKKMEGDNYITPEEQNEALKEAYEHIKKMPTDKNGLPIVEEPDGIPDEFKQNFENK